MHLFRVLRFAGLGAALSLAAATSRADITIEQKTTLDVASLIRAHGSSTTNITADKKREDSESHCEGMMSLVCGNVRSGEIVRLDRALTWHLAPEKKSYREDIFATPEELAQLRTKMQARLEKMRSCPVTQKQQPVEKSKCEMSPPKVDVHKTDDRTSIAGHVAQRTLATLTETCTNKETGDVCDTVVAIDLWLTQDNLPGTGDQQAFGRAYAKKMGMDPQGAMGGEFAKYLAPYQSQIKQLTDQSRDFKGQPLKTSVRVMMGGPQCGTTRKANGSAGGDNPGGNAGNPMTNAAQAGKAVGSSAVALVGSLFHKKKTDDSPAAASTAQPEPSSGAASPPGGGTAAAGAIDPYAQFSQLAAFSVETLNISTDAVPAERFEVPKDWKKEVPKASKQDDDEFTCPRSQS